jgi:uncharacterized membrane protein YtjA (UPF0391 family)
MWGVWQVKFFGLRVALYPGEEADMLHWSLVFLVIAIIAAILGFGGIAGTAVGIAKILFFVFLVIWLIAFIFGRRAV